jgi:uncharacterized phage-associated protein
MAYKALDIAKKLLCRAANSEVGEFMSNIKLQKMLYYQQGFHLALFGTPLFDDDIEAWMYGPVIPNVYNHYKDHGSFGIKPTDDDTEIALTDKEEALFDEVYQVYGAYSASGLVNMTHQESPWKSAGIGNIIPTDKLTEFFKTRLQ